MNAQLLRRLSDVAAAGRHSRHDVLPLESFDSLLPGDAIADQLANDCIQAVVDTHRFNLFGVSGLDCGGARFYYRAIRNMPQLFRVT